MSVHKISIRITFTLILVKLLILKPYCHTVLANITKQILTSWNIIPSPFLYVYYHVRRYGEIPVCCQEFTPLMRFDSFWIENVFLYISIYTIINMFSMCFSLQFWKIPCRGVGSYPIVFVSMLNRCSYWNDKGSRCIYVELVELEDNYLFNIQLYIYDMNSH